MFSFFTRLITDGYRKPLAIKDLPQTLYDIQSEYCYRKYAAGTKIGIVRSVLKTHWTTIGAGCIIKIFFITTMFLVPNE